MMNHEYIVPMTDQTREISLYLSPVNGFPAEGIPSPSRCTSLKPKIHFSSPCFVRGDGMEGEGVVEITCAYSPEIPLDILKSLTVVMLTAGVSAVGEAVRDPAGGNVELLLAPLLRLLHSLLVMGVLEDEDLGKILRLMEPSVFSLSSMTLREEDEDQASNDEQGQKWIEKENDMIKQGLLQMKLPEAVKLEVKLFLTCSFSFSLSCVSF